MRNVWIYFRLAVHEEWSNICALCCSIPDFDLGSHKMQQSLFASVVCRRKLFHTQFLTCFNSSSPLRTTLHFTHGNEQTSNSVYEIVSDMSTRQDSLEEKLAGLEDKLQGLQVSWYQCQRMLYVLCIRDWHVNDIPLFWCSINALCITHF